MAESRQQKRDREMLAQLRADTSEVWNSPRITKRPEPELEVSEAEIIENPSNKAPKLSIRHPVFEMVCETVRLNGFTHPEQGQFIMLPREFEALLALEKKAVVQVVFLILRETIGWMDEDGRYQRREWVQLGQRHFEVTCGSKSQGFYGVKTAIQKGYILRRPCKNSFEYSIRWKGEE